MLLALCVALVNASSGITALWVLLACLGWVLFLSFLVRPVFMKILRRTRSIEDGPTQSIVALTLMIALASAFFTGVIGVHPIFGAFLAGLICPHEGGFAIKVTEKVEDLVTTLFLPLYFALSGLSTNLGLLDTGITWAYVVGVVAVAFSGKMIGGSGAARLNGLVWRECFTIGSLMSCKGLVELIVLNIGLQAKILSTRTFTIFVVMALVTTFATTPLTSYLYPPWYQQKLEAWKRGEIDWDTGRRRDSFDGDSHDAIQVEKLGAAPIRKILVYLRLDSLPTTLEITSSLRQHQRSARSSTSNDGENGANSSTRSDEIATHGLRLLPLTERDSSVMKVSEVAEYTPHDPVVNTFLAFGALHGVSTSGEVAISPESSFAFTLANKAQEVAADLLLLPWAESGSMSEAAVVSATESRAKLANSPFSSFVQETFEVTERSAHVGVMITNGSGAVSSTFEVHERKAIVVPFFGAADDKLAVRLALQLASNSLAQVYIHNVGSADTSNVAPEIESSAEEKQGSRISIAPSSIPTEQRQRFLSTMKATLPSDAAERIHIISTESAGTFEEALDSTATTISRDLQQRNNLVLLGRNLEVSKLSLRRTRTGDSVQNAVPNASCLGALADKLLLAQATDNKRERLQQARGSLLVVQARRS